MASFFHPLVGGFSHWPEEYCVTYDFHLDSLGSFLCSGGRRVQEHEVHLGQRGWDVLVDGDSSSEVMGWLKTKVGDTTMACDLCQSLSLACCTCWKCIWGQLLSSYYPYFSSLWNTQAKTEDEETLGLNTSSAHWQQLLIMARLWIFWLQLDVAREHLEHR